MYIHVRLSAHAAMLGCRSIPIQWDGLMWHSGLAAASLRCAASVWLMYWSLKFFSRRRALRMLKLLLCCQPLLTVSLYRECRWQKLLWKSLSFQWGCYFLPTNALSWHMVLNMPTLLQVGQISKCQPLGPSKRPSGCIFFVVVTIMTVWRQE